VAHFVPHVTLLYNIEQFENPLELMEECLNQYKLNQSQKPNVVQLQRQRETTNANSDEEEDADGMSQPTIIPYNWYYMHYPKYADNGNGFGCSISLLLIKTSRWLEELQQACQETLGPDERRKFVPHVSMVYAPEEREASLQAYTREQQKLQTFLNRPFRAKYLSLWSTQGRLQNWYRIAKIAL
jgi:2'-5' RNA ligase